MIWILKTLQINFKILGPTFICDYSRIYVNINKEVYVRVILFDVFKLQLAKVLYLCQTPYVDGVTFRMC